MNTPAPTTTWRNCPSEENWQQKLEHLYSALPVVEFPADLIEKLKEHSKLRQQAESK